MGGLRELMGDDEAARAYLRRAVEQHDDMEFVSADLAGPRVTMVVRIHLHEPDGRTYSREGLYAVEPEHAFENGEPSEGERLRWHFLGWVDDHAGD